MKTKLFFKNHALQEGVLFALLGGALTWYSLDGYSHSFYKRWPESPFLFPLIIAGLLILLALLQIVSGFRQVAATSAVPTEEKKAASGKQILRVLGVLLLCLLYYLALSYIKLPYMACTVFGFTLRLSVFEISTVIFLFAMMFYLNVRKPLVLTLVPLCITFFLSFLFRSLLYVLLP